MHAPQTPGPVSAIIKAKNEAHQIADCIASLKNFATEIIVVDDDSDDNTADIATTMGARVVSAKSKNREINEMDVVGFKAATQPWLLRIDADERMTPTLGKELLRVATAGEYAGVCFARQNMMFGAWARHGGWFRNDQLRFFRADAWDQDWYYQDIHSQVPVRGPILALPLKKELATIHHDYESVQQYIHRTLWAYGKNEAEVDHRAGRPFSGSRLLLKPMKRFWGRLIIRQGFRDGWRGVILAGMYATYDFCIEANLWDIERQAGKRQ
jgi:glycosyltransferase involved in cell wall biosynthesis